MEKELQFLKKIYSRSYKLYKEGHYTQCLDLLSNTSEIWVEYKQKYIFITLMGKILLKLNQMDQAERVLLESLALLPDNIPALDAIGQLYYRKNRFVDAEKAYLTASRIDIYNFYFAIKAAQSAWMSGNYRRMFKRLKEGYINKAITPREEKFMKDLLIDFLRNSKIPEAYLLVKKFRSWFYEKKKRFKKNYRNDIRHKK